MKLYEVPRNTRVRITESDIRIPPGAPKLMPGDEVDFGHIDGMYSYCKKDGEVVHLAAWTEVEIVKGHTV